MSKAVEVHLESLLGDVKEAQEFFDTVLFYNTADLWSDSSFVTLLKRRKMAKSEAVLERLSEGFSRLSPDFLPALPRQNSISWKQRLSKNWWKLGTI